MTVPNGTPKTVVTSPDPSDRTTASLSHEIATMKELFSERFVGQERAVTLLQGRADKSPSIDVVNADLISLAKVTAETFKRLEEISKLRAYYSEKLAIAESKRIDAIRIVDVNAVSVERTRASDQASVLAGQVTQSAETLRSLVASTAASVAASLQQQTGPLITRITSLEQAGYQAQGKQSFADPAFVQLLAEVKHLQEGRAGSDAKSVGIDKTWGVVAVVVALIISAAAAIIANERSATPLQPTQPIIYLGPPPNTQQPMVIQPRQP